MKLCNQIGYLHLKSDPCFQDLEFANDFNDINFKVDIFLGADATYHFLGPIDDLKSSFFNNLNSDILFLDHS